MLSVGNNVIQQRSCTVNNKYQAPQKKQTLSAPTISQEDKRKKKTKAILKGLVTAVSLLTIVALGLKEKSRVKDDDYIILETLDD